MAEEDIYHNKAAFERLKNNLASLLQPPAIPETKGRNWGLLRK